MEGHSFPSLLTACRGRGGWQLRLCQGLGWSRPLQCGSWLSTGSFRFWRLTICSVKEGERERELYSLPFIYIYHLSSFIYISLIAGLGHWNKRNIIGIPWESLGSSRHEPKQPAGNLRRCVVSHITYSIHGNLVMVWLDQETSSLSIV